MSINDEIKQFYYILKNISTNFDFKTFKNQIQKIKLLSNTSSRYYHSQKLSDINIYAQVFGRQCFYQLEKFIYNWIKENSNQNKIALYKQINQKYEEFVNSIKDNLTNQKINTYIKELLEIDTDMLNRHAKTDANFNLIQQIYELIKHININDIHIHVYRNIINNEFKSREKFIKNKIKSIINEAVENSYLDQETDQKPELFFLKELKKLNNPGTTYNVAKELVYEINNSVKDKFIWLNGEYIDSSMGYGLHHGIMYLNKILELRNESLDEEDKYYISNTRQPEDLAIETTEEENNLPVAFGSFYFNNQVCIIEGRYKIERNDKNYNQLIKELTSKFTHVFDLTISNKKLKQEAKLLCKVKLL